MNAKKAGWLRLIPLVATLLSLGLPVVASAAVSYSGRAYAAYVNTHLTGPLFISDTGELPSSGGYRNNALLGVNVPGVLSASVLNASTAGSGGESNGFASLANVDVLPGSPYRLTASFLRSEAHADCDGVSGESEIVGLTFMGQTVQVSGHPNQTISIPGVATLVINEQRTTSRNRYHEIQVNAIHLTVKGVAEVILSSAKADISCPPSAPPPPRIIDFITGGGWITHNGAKINFGFNAGFKPNATTPDGHFNMVDHSNGMKMHATSVTNYWGSGNSRTFRGSCEVNNQPGFTYWVEAADNGEPGKNLDWIKISISNGYYRTGLLGGGNIQLHSR